MLERDRNSERPASGFRKSFEKAVAGVAMGPVVPKDDDGEPWHIRFDTQVGDDNSLAISARFQRYRSIHLRPAYGIYSAPATTTAIDKRSQNLLDGTHTVESIVGPHEAVVAESDTNGIKNTNGTLTALYMSVLEQPLTQAQLTEVVDSYYENKDSIYQYSAERYGLIPPTIVGRIISVLDEQDDSVRQNVLQQIADNVNSSDYREKHIAALNKQVINTLLQRKDDGNLIEPRMDFLEFIENMRIHNLDDVYQYARPDLMAHPKVAAYLLAEQNSGVDIFADIKVGRRLTYAQEYIGEILDHIAVDETRHEANVTGLKKRLFVQKHRNTISWTDMVTLSNNFTQVRNHNISVEHFQQLLPATGDSKDLVFLGEALFRLLDVTSRSEHHADENRNYAELLDGLLQPIYAQFGQRSTYTSAEDVRRRYPGMSAEQIDALMKKADNGGYNEASNYYAEVRRVQGKSVFHKRNKSGYGIIS